MNLLQPIMLGLLALGGLVWLLHARQRIAAGVSSLLIWERVRQKNSKRQVTSWRPRINWLMVLQVLILSALVAALAEPIIGANRGVDHWIYVLDNSASMQAGARDSALAQLAERLDAPDPTAAISLIVAGLQARPILAALPPGTENLAARLSAITPEDGGADWLGADRIASALSTPGQTTRIVILTDGATPEAFSGREGVETVSFPTSTQNAALTATLIDDLETGEMRAQGRVQFSGDLAQTTVTVAWRGADVDAPEILARHTIAATDDPNGMAEFALPFPRPGEGTITVVLADDAAGFDNRAHFRVHAEPVIARILYLGDEDHPLARALSAVPGANISFNRGASDFAQFDLVVANGRIPDGPVPTNFLTVAASGPEAQLLQPPIAPSLPQSTHPLATAVNWPSLSIDQASALEPREGAQTLVASGPHPLVDVMTGEDGLDIRLAFDPAASDWPERSDFVVFVDQLVKMVVPAAGQTVDPVCRVGEPCVIAPAFAGGRLSRIDSPEPIAATVGDSFVPDRAGLFEVSSNGRTQTLAIHPPTRSDLAAPMPAMPAMSDTPDLPQRPIALWPWLIALAVALLLVEAAIAHRRKRKPADWLRANLLRMTALGLAVLAVANLRLPMLSTDQLTLVVRPALAADMAAGDQTDTVYYRDAMAPESAAPSLVGDMDAAVALALAMIPQDIPGSVIAMGRAPLGQGQGLAHRLADGGRSIDAVATPSAPPGDVWVGDIAGPEFVFPGDAFFLQAVIGSAGAIPAEISVIADGEPIHSQTMDLIAGDNTLSIPVTANDTGPMVVEVTVAADADPRPINNAMGRVFNIGAPGHVAVLAGDAAAGDSFARAIIDQGFAADIVDPAAAPTISAGWDGYDALVLINLPAADLVTDQQRAIEAGVREGGLGLAILGGANSFGPGGYLETPLDEVSPISSRVPRDKPGVALVFVLDRSSSMSQAVGPVTRLDIAKQATLAAARLLDEDSSVSVVAFDSRARLSLPLTGVSEMDFIERSIGQISLGGGTALQRGLAAGYDQIRRTDAAARHIIVMTDGLSQPSNYSALMGSIIEDEITVSTVAIGEEAEHELLQWLASESGGVFHASTDFEALPSILSQEAMRLSGDAFETAHVEPDWIAERPGFLSGLPDVLPAIDGYVLASIKPEAATLATLDDTTGQPVPYIAHWQYGVGHVMAMTTDAFGGWTTDWQASEEYPRFFSQTLRAFQRPPRQQGYGLASVQDAAGLHLSLTGAADLAPEIAVQDPQTTLVSLSSGAAGPERFDAFIAPKTTGPQLLTVGPEPQTVGVYANYPQSLNPSATIDAGLSLANQTGGRVLEDGAPYARPIAPYWTAHAIWPILAGAALIAFLLDLVHRYSGFALPRRFAGFKSR